MSLSPELAEEVFEYLQQEHTLKEFKDEFCPDVSEYKGMVIVCMSYSFFRGGSWSQDVLLTEEEWDQIDIEDDLYLGEVNGKWSDVVLSVNKVLDDEIRDPYDIKEYMEHHDVRDSYSVLHELLKEN